MEVHLGSCNVLLVDGVGVCISRDLRLDEQTRPIHHLCTLRCISDFHMGEERQRWPLLLRVQSGLPCEIIRACTIKPRHEVSSQPSHTSSLLPFYNIISILDTANSSSTQSTKVSRLQLPTPIMDAVMHEDKENCSPCTYTVYFALIRSLLYKAVLLLLLCYAMLHMYSR